MLPTNAKAVTDHNWHSEDEALYDIVEHISTVVKALRIRHYLQEASSLAQEQRYEEALALYEQALLLEPQDALALRGKGEVLLVLERYAESLQALNTVLQIDPSVADASFYQSKAQALRHLQCDTEALAMYQQAARLEPTYSEPDVDETTCMHYMLVLLREAAEELKKLGRRGVIIRRVYARSQTPTGIAMVIHVGMEEYPLLPKTGKLVRFMLDIEKSNSFLVLAYKEEFQEWKKEYKKQPIHK